MASAAVATKRSFAVMMSDAAQSQEWSQRTSEPPSSRVRAAGPSAAESTLSSAASTPRSTPAPAPAPTAFLERGRCDHGPDASVVLVGIRGSGKSTLAIMASVAFRRRVVDVEQQFQEATGFSTAKYRKQFGASNHNLRQEELLRTTLNTYDKGAIIVCNGGSLERSGQVLLQEFAQSHPVIHIMRDVDSVHRYLEVLPLSKLQNLVAFTTPIFRRCSNFEFYNISEIRAATSVVPANQPSLPAFLTLKRAERTFIKFLSLVIPPPGTKEAPPESSSTFEPAFPLSQVPVELRKYTCAVQVPLEDLSDHVDIEELEFGSDAFEIVVNPVTLDANSNSLPSERAEHISNAVSWVRRSTIVPIIYHVMPTIDRNLATSYMEHVRHGLRTAPEFSTVDLSMNEDFVHEIVASRGSTKIIGHLHAPRDWYDVFWLTKYDAAVRLGCSAVRFTRPAQFMDDNAAIQTFRNAIRMKTETIPLICFNTGRAGRRSACFNQVLTSVIPETVRGSPEFASRVESHPETPWLSVKEANHVLYASFTYDPMKFYIIGASAGYSLSPAMHNAAYKVYGMPHRYETFQTATLDSLQELARDSNFGGAAVSQPFKLEVIPFLHSMSRHARAIGAVNTVIAVRHLDEEGNIPTDLDLFTERNQSGTIKALYGDNTDWIGIMSCIRRGLSPANAVRSTTCGLVIGSGGMARAAVYAMLQIGVTNIVIFNRTYVNAEKLVAHFDGLLSSSASSNLLPFTTSTQRPTFRILESRDEPWPDEFRPPTIVVSCIPTHPVGNLPKPSFTLPTQWMHSRTGGVVIELAYRTLDTPLMRQIREDASEAWVCLDGLDLLPEQGFPQFELFTGKRAPRRVMREEVLRSWRDEHGHSDPAMVQTRLGAIDRQQL